MFRCLQFVIITYKLFLGVLVFGVAIILAISNIDYKMFGCAKLGFKVLDYQIKVLILLLGRSPCPKGVRIVIIWCYTPFIESKETLYSVPIWFS